MCVVVQKEWVEKEIRLINESKVSKEKDIPVKKTKGNEKKISRSK